MKFYLLVGKAKDGCNKFAKVTGTNIFIAVDNDKAGEQMREKYAGVYKSIIPKNKDWNDDLCEMDRKKNKEMEL